MPDVFSLREGSDDIQVGFGWIWGPEGQTSVRYPHPCMLQRFIDLL